MPVKADKRQIHGHGSERVGNRPRSRDGGAIHSRPRDAVEVWEKSYGQVAQGIGRPGAVRAVGQACGANPIPVMIPCHRVLAAGGKLGGFSSGLDWKRKLLAREGAIPDAD